MKHKVLFVIGDLDVGGAERHLVQVLPLLKGRGIEATVFTITHKGHLSPILERSGVKVVQPFFGGNVRNFPKFIRKIILVPVSTISLFIEMCKGYGIFHFFLPTAYLFGGTVGLMFPSRLKIMSRRSLNFYQEKHCFLTAVERWLHGKMDAVLANSFAVRADLDSEGVAKERLGLIYNGIEKAFGTGRSSSDIRAELQISSNALVYIIVANLIEYKGHADLVRALEIASASLASDWVLLVVGKDCGIGEALKVQAEEAGIGANIHWLGLREDIPDLLAASDIGILSSHQEGFSNSILEYMAAALPVIASDVGGNKEAVLDGETGFIVPPNDPESLAKAIVRMSADEVARTRMGRVGQDRFSSHFTLNVCVSRYEKLYRGLLEGSPLPVQAMIDRSSPVTAEVGKL